MIAVVFGYFGDRYSSLPCFAAAIMLQSHFPTFSHDLFGLLSL